MGRQRQQADGSGGEQAAEDQPTRRRRRNGEHAGPLRAGPRRHAPVAWLIAACLALPLALGAPGPGRAQDPAPASDELGAGVVEGEAGEAQEDDGLPRVVLATFTTEISDREPVDDVSFLGSDKRVVYFFTDLRNMKGQTIRHVWTYEDNEMGSVEFVVKGDRWRFWSSKQLLPAWLGSWSVSVLNDEDEVLATESFTYQETP